MGIKTSTTGYIILSKQGYENKPAIPTGKKEGDIIECISFMSPDSQRLVWVRRNEISSGELTQVALWKN